MSGKLGDIVETIKASFRWVWTPLKGMLMPVFTPIIFGVVFYILGWNLKNLPEVEIALTNGFYILGYNVNFKFADLFGTIAFATSSIGVIFRASYGGGGSAPLVDAKGRQTNIPLDLDPDEVYKPKVQIEDISGNLSLITLTQEKILQKHNILDVDDVSLLKPQDVMTMLNVSPSLAQRIIDEAMETLTEWRRQGLL